MQSNYRAAELKKTLKLDNFKDFKFFFYAVCSFYQEYKK